MQGAVRKTKSVDFIIEAFGLGCRRTGMEVLLLEEDVMSK